MPLGYGTEVNTGSYQDDIGQLPTPTTYEESKAASQDLAWKDTATGLLARRQALNDAQLSGRQLSPEEANSKFPDMANPFREPVSETAATYLHEQQYETQNQEEKVANGPQDTWSKIKLTGVGLLAHLKDPIETGTALLGGWLLGGALKAGYLGTTAARLATAAAAPEASLALRASVHAGIGATEMAVQSTGLEVAKARVQTAEQIPYDPMTGMQDIAVGTLFGAGLGAVAPEILRGGSDIFSASRNKLANILRRTSPEADLQVGRNAVANVQDHFMPKVEDTVKNLSQETSVHVNSEFEPHPETLPEGKKLYVPSGNGDFVPSKKFYASDAMGDGVHGTDSPEVANAAAARAMSDGAGKVWEVDGSGMKSYNLDGPIEDPKVKAVFEDALEKSHIDESIDGKSGKEVTDMIDSYVNDFGHDPAGVKAYQDGMKDLGYDALSHTGDERNGFPHEPHNAFMFLKDPAELEAKTKGAYDATDSIRRPVDPEDIAHVQDERTLDRRVDIDTGAAKEATDRMNTFDSEASSVDKHLDDMTEAHMEEFKNLEQQGLLEGQDLKDYNDLKELSAQTELHDKLLKAVMHCVGG